MNGQLTEAHRLFMLRLVTVVGYQASAPSSVWRVVKADSRRISRTCL